MPIINLILQGSLDFKNFKTSELLAFVITATNSTYLIILSEIKISPIESIVFLKEKSNIFDIVIIDKIIF